MTLQVTWSRRRFLKNMGRSSIAAAVAPLVRLPALSAESQSRRFAYVTSRAGITSDQGIHVFAVSGQRWVPLQFVPSACPSAVIASADGGLLFVANAIDSYRHSPRGSVESYAVDPHTRRLSLLSRQGLSLSATEPGHLALSPDGRSLAVAVPRGGAYNVLPVRPDGTLGPVAAIRKEIGSGPHPELQRTACPQQILFDQRGRLMAADRGMDSISIYTLTSSGIELTHRRRVPPGSGPAHMVLDQDSGRAFLGHALNGDLSTFFYDAHTASTHELRATDPHGGAEECTAVALCSKGLLFSASSSRHGAMIRSWSVSGSELRHLRTYQDATARFTTLSCSLQQDALIALDEKGNRIQHFHLDSEAGRFSTAASVSTVPAPSSIAWVQG